MADDIREYVRAAQEAELRGDHGSAAELLWKAAQLYRSSGKPSRALSMLRQALKLDGGRKDVEDEIRRLEWLPEEPMRTALGGDEALEEEMKKLLAPLELPGDPDKPLVERGPTLADPSLSAWCSFCCKPKSEVGALVAGPAGAFVCRGCIGESAKLLGAAEAAAMPELPSGTVARVLSLVQSDGTESPPSDDAASDSFSPSLSRPQRSEEEPTTDSEPPPSPASIDLPHQSAAKRDVEQAMAWGRRRILLLGPKGAGKTTVLRALADSHHGLLLTGASTPRSVPSDWVLLIDDPTRAGSLWERHGGVVVLAVEGQPVQPAAFLLTEDARVSLPTTRAILDATRGALSIELAEAVDAVVSIDGGDATAHDALVMSLLRSRGFADEFVTEMSKVILDAAKGTERGAHEIVALVNRIPPGAWRLEAAEAVPVSVASNKGSAKKKGRGKKGQG